MEDIGTENHLIETLATGSRGLRFSGPLVFPYKGLVLQGEIDPRSNELDRGPTGSLPEGLAVLLQSSFRPAYPKPGQTLKPKPKP